MNTDPIADMLTRVRNAQLSAREEVLIPRSNLKVKIAEVLKEEGYISEVRDVEENGKANLKIRLKYSDDKPVITKIKRISKPGRRMYVKCTDIPRVIGGLGVVIVSTPKGVMSGEQARKQKIGGEVICEVY